MSPSPLSSIISGNDHIALAVTDVPRVSDWYCRMLGYTVAHRAEGAAWLLRAPDGTFLEIMQQLDEPRPTRAVCTPGLSHIAVRVLDFDNAQAWLQSQGVTWLSEEVTATGGGRLRSCADPDGNMVQIVQRA